MIINNLCKQFVIIYSLNFKILRVIECTLADWTQYSSDYIKNAVKNRFFQRRILIENTGSVLNFSHFNVRPYGLTSTLFSVLKQITRPTVGLNVIVGEIQHRGRSISSVQFRQKDSQQNNIYSSLEKDVTEYNAILSISSADFESISMIEKCNMDR